MKWAKVKPLCDLMFTLKLNFISQRLNSLKLVKCFAFYNEIWTHHKQMIGCSSLQLTIDSETKTPPVHKLIISHIKTSLWPIIYGYTNIYKANMANFSCNLIFTVKPRVSRFNGIREAKKKPLWNFLFPVKQQLTRWISLYVSSFLLTWCSSEWNIIHWNFLGLQTWCMKAWSLWSSVFTVKLKLTRIITWSL